jgi:hypothetical protein
MSWIRIENRFDAALLVLILSLLNSDEKIRLIVRFEMNSSDDFVDCQLIVFAPIGNNKHLTNPTYPVINRLILLRFRL